MVDTMNAQNDMFAQAAPAEGGMNPGFGFGEGGMQMQSQSDPLADVDIGGGSSAPGFADGGASWAPSGDQFVKQEDDDLTEEER